MRLIIDGPPIPKARPKFHAAGKYTKAYDPQKSLMDLIALQIKSQIPHKFPIETPIVIDIDFQLTTPASFKTKQNNAASWGMLFHVSKPDIDNLAKFYLDILSGLAYEDDRQIIELNVKKNYTNKDQTIIDIMPKITYEEALNQFFELIDLDDFCELTEKLSHLTKFFKSSYAVRDESATSHAKDAFLLLREISSKYGKVINDTAKRHKNLKESQTSKLLNLLT